MREDAISPFSGLPSLQDNQHLIFMTFHVVLKTGAAIRSLLCQAGRVADDSGAAAGISTISRTLLLLAKPHLLALISKYLVLRGALLLRSPAVITLSL